MAALSRELDTGGADPGPLVVPPEELAAALERADPMLVAALELAAANVRDVAASGVGADRDVALPQGQRVRLRELPGPPRRRLRARRPRALPQHGRDGRHDGPRRRRRADRRVLPAGHRGPCPRRRPRRVRGVRRGRGARDGRRAGGRRAGLRDRDGAAGRRRSSGRAALYVQEAKRQVAARSSASTASPGPSELVVILDGAERGGASVALDLLAQAEHGPDSPVVALSPAPAALDAVSAALDAAPAPDEPPARLLDAPDLDAALALRRGVRARAPPARGRRRRGAGRARQPRGLPVRRPPRRHRLRRLRRRLQPRAADGRRGALRLGALAAPLPAPHVGGPDRRRAPGWTSSRAPAPRSRRAEGFVRHAESMEARMRENQAT